MADLAGVADLAGLLGSLTVILGVLFAAAQLREMRRRRDIETAFSMMTATQNLEFVQAARRVRSLREGWEKDFSALAPEDQDAVVLVLERIDHAALMVHRGLVSSDLLADAFGPGMLVVWRKLRPFVELQRARHPGGHLGMHFARVVGDLERHVGGRPTASPPDRRA